VRPDETGPTDETGRVWSADSACASAEAAHEFAAWFDRTRVDWDSCQLHAPDVPLSRVYEVADESLRRAKLWSDFAAALQMRAANLNRGR
jgi:hypothetical protein